MAIIEPRLEFFAARRKNVFTYPMLAGYRYTFNGEDDGFYVEPVAGYTSGTSNIRTIKSAGDTVDQKVNGCTAYPDKMYIRQ